MLPAFLQANGIDRSKIEEIVGDANVLLPMLMSRRVDGVLGQTVHVDRYKKSAAQQRMTATSMNYSDYGLDAYGNALFAKDDTITGKPAAGRAFRRSFAQGRR